MGQAGEASKPRSLKNRARKMPSSSAHYGTSHALWSKRRKCVSNLQAAPEE